MFMLGVGALVEVGSFIGSYVIITKGVIDGFLQIPDAGYKFDIDKCREETNNNKKDNNKQSSFLSKLIPFVPVVNLLYAKVNTDKLKKEINDAIPSFLEKGYIVSMTDKEKEKYSCLSNNMQRLQYSCIREDEDNELIGFLGDEPIVVDHGLTSLYYDRLMPLAYTLDEVKKLNEATTYSYRLGMVDGISTAIIGIPNPDYKIKRVHYNTDPSDIDHDFIPVTEEEAKEKTFIIYPFTNVYKNENFNSCFENLRKDRNKPNYSFSNNSDIKNIEVDKPKVLTKIYK